MELQKQDTKMLQGLSVLAMVWLHLFDRNYQGLFVPKIFFMGVPLSFYIAQLCDFCVFGFAFCSGYAHMLLVDEKGYYQKRLKGLRTLLCNYWLIMIIFCVVSIFVGQADRMPGSVSKFFMNALTLENSYNGAWWYMFTYIVLVIMSPTILKFVKKANPILVLILGFGIYCCAYYVRFKVETDNWFIVKFGPFGMTFFEYLIGATCCKTRAISKIYNVCKKSLPKTVRWIITGVLLASMLFARTKVIPSLFFAPITGFVIILLFHFSSKPDWVRNVFSMIGKHSTNIWLTHMFFYSCIFEKFVYIAKYPVLIYALMLEITLTISIILTKMNSILKKKISQIVK